MIHMHKMKMHNMMVVADITDSVTAGGVMKRLVSRGVVVLLLTISIFYLSLLKQL